MSYTGGELERRQQSAPVPYQRGQHAAQTVTVVNWPEFATWARGRGVVIAGLVLIAAQLVWKAVFLTHYYFWQDDFHFMEVALSHPFNWSYVTFNGAGHLSPGMYTVFWVVARGALYNWTAASAITIVLLALAGLTGLRLLRTLFGDRPAILVPLVIYLMSPLTMPTTRWWSAAVEMVPLQAAIFLALTSQVHYVRTRRVRHAFAATFWVLIALAFFEKALVLPLLLFGVSSGFLMEGSWPRAMARCLTRYWPAWIMQIVAMGAYALVLKGSLHTSSVQPTVPGTAGGVATFIWTLIKNTFVPGALGGPWQWFPQSTVQGGAQWAYSAPPSALIWLSLIVAACVILASVWARRYAWRAWAILVVWLLAADAAPVVLGRIGALGQGAPALFGLETRYVADAVPVLAICVGLAFLPVAGLPDLRQKRRMGTLQSTQAQPGRLVAAGLVGAFIIGSVYSVQTFQSDTNSLAARIFIENARAALAEAPAGTIILNQPVPAAVMIPLFGKNDRDSKVVKPTESTAAAARIRWTSSPTGTIDHLLAFGADGRLHQVAVYGQASMPFKPGQAACQQVSRDQAVVSFTSPTAPGTRVLRIAYLASSTVNGDQVTVRYGSTSQVLSVQSGLHSAYFSERGSAQSVTISGAALANGGLCVGAMRAGILYASNKGPAIPAAF